MADIMSARAVARTEKNTPRRKAKVIHMKSSYPRSECSKRPFHLWNAKTNEYLRYRYYGNAKRAHTGALIEARWAKVGDCIHVVNVQYGRFMGEYVRTLTSIDFRGPQRAPTGE